MQICLWHRLPSIDHSLNVQAVEIMIACLFVHRRFACHAGLRLQTSGAHFLTSFVTYKDTILGIIVQLPGGHILCADDMSALLDKFTQGHKARNEECVFRYSLTLRRTL